MAKEEVKTPKGEHVTVLTGTEAAAVLKQNTDASKEVA